jgi:hypothetical protein
VEYYAGSGWRYAFGSLFAGVGGTINNLSDFMVSALSTPGMAVNVSAGQAWVNGTMTYPQGKYFVLSTVQEQVTIPAADPSNPRYDLITLTVTDPAQGETNPAGATLQDIAGTPGSSPVPPTAPPNSLILAQVYVAAGATSITSSDLWAPQSTPTAPVPYVNSPQTYLNAGITAPIQATGDTSHPAGYYGNGVMFYDANGTLWGNIDNAWQIIGGAKQPAGLLVASGAQSIPSGTVTQVTMAAGRNPVGGVSYTSNGITVPRTAFYELSAGILWDYTGTTAVALTTEVYVNGAQAYSTQVITDLAAPVNCELSRLIYLSADDTLTLYGYQDTGSSIAIGYPGSGLTGDSYQTWLSVHYVQESNG